MKHFRSMLLAGLSLAACRSDPWEVCSGWGDTGMQGRAPSCETTSCRACAERLTTTWRRRSEPGMRAEFRVRFLRCPADARDRFVATEHPDGPFAAEHCTVSLAQGRRCAALGPTCSAVIADGLASGDTAVAWRTQFELATARACPDDRGAVLARLRRCEVPSGMTSCEGSPCVDCTRRRLASLALIAPGSDRPEGAAELQSLVRDTPEPVARAIIESLGAPDTPADLEPTVVQRGLRNWCFRVVETSERAPPFACNAVMTRFLAHTEYPDATRAWEALSAARENVRGGVLDGLMSTVARAGSIPAPVDAKLRELPREGTIDALTRAAHLPTATDGAYAGLRALLAAHGVAERELPPAVRPAAPPPSAAPSTDSGRGGHDLPTRPWRPAGAV